MDGRRRLVPKVAQKSRASASKKRKAPAKKRTTRVTRRQNIGAMEALGAKLDEGVPVVAAGVLQLAFLSVFAAALLAVLATAFSGQVRGLPERVAALPENLGRSFGLNVMRVTINGAPSLSERDIMTALRDEKHGSVVGRPLMTVNAEDMRLAIEALGPVKHAAVQKLLPNTLHISVIERRPKALYQNAEGEYFVIDDEGAIIKSSSPTAYTQLPVISGTETPGEVTGFLVLLRQHPVLFARTAGIEVVNDQRFDLRFRNGFLAKLPEDNVAQALRRLDSLEAGTGSLAASLDYIDLRDPKWAYYKPKEKQGDR